MNPRKNSRKPIKHHFQERRHETLKIPGSVLSLLENFKKGVPKCLKADVIAMYVYGSLVMNDFVSESSDIDFLVIVKAMRSESALRLENLHATLESHPYGKRLEGDYIPLSQLSLKGGSGTCCGYYDTFKQVPGDMISPDTLMTILDSSITLYGPPPEEILPPVKEEDIKAYMAKTLPEYREEFINPKRYTPQELASEVLNMCRSYHAFLNGEIVSKSCAAAIALKELPERWHPLIEAALKVRSGSESPTHNNLLKEETGKFAEFLAELSTSH